jgi:uncharacterized membrane protein
MQKLPSHPAPSAADKDTGRLESFSDGVFSVAMTLLVVGLTVPALPAKHAVPTAAYLWSELGKNWPSYFAFLTSFATVLIMWINHHGIFKLIRRTDGTLLFTNGFLLLLVTVVPFPTALVADYLLTPAASVACVVYGGTFVLISISYGAVLIAARRGGHVLPEAKPEVDARIRSCFRIGTPLYVLAAISGAFSPWLSLGICSALWLYWAMVGIRGGRAFGV